MEGAFTGRPRVLFRPLNHGIQRERLLTLDSPFRADLPDCDSADAGAIDAAGVVTAADVVGRAASM